MKKKNHHKKRIFDLDLKGVLINGHLHLFQKENDYKKSHRHKFINYALALRLTHLIDFL